MFGQLASTFILLGSIASYKPANNLRQIETQQADTQTNENLLYGSYCWLNSWDDSLDYYYDDVLEESTSWRSYVFTDLTNVDEETVYSVSVNKGDNSYQELFLEKLSIRCDDDPEHATVKFDVFDLYMNTTDFDFQETIYWNTQDIDDRTYPNLIIYVRNSRYLNDDFIKGFNAIFSHNANSHTVYYNGYYNFTTTSSLTQNKIFVTGTQVFNNSLYIGFSNYQGGGSFIRFFFYNVNDETYNGLTYNYPFQASQGIGTTTNILMNNALMSNDTYNYLSNVGVFSYVRDNTFDNTTFGDLLFSVMDTPIYFITRLLSFELFGVNMFVAFTGLLTICVILVLIRKFF